MSLSFLSILAKIHATFFQGANATKKSKKMMTKSRTHCSQMLKVGEKMPDFETMIFGIRRLGGSKMAKIEIFGS